MDIMDDLDDLGDCNHLISFVITSPVGFLRPLDPTYPTWCGEQTPLVVRLRGGNRSNYDTWPCRPSRPSRPSHKVPWRSSQHSWPVPQGWISWKLVWSCLIYVDLCWFNDTQNIYEYLRRKLTVKAWWTPPPFSAPSGTMQLLRHGPGIWVTTSSAVPSPPASPWRCMLRCSNCLKLLESSWVSVSEINELKIAKNSQRTK